MIHTTDYLTCRDVYGVKTNHSCLVLFLLAFLLNLNTPNTIPPTNTTVTAPNIAPPMNAPTVTAVVSLDGDGRVPFKYSIRIRGMVETNCPVCGKEGLTGNQGTDRTK